MIRSALALFLIISGVLNAEITEERIVSAGVKFRVVRVSPEKVGLVWKDESGEPYRSFDRVQAAFAKRGKTVKFIMNAGIFEPGGIPSGLHIQDGKLIRPLNPADAPGNFFLKPNGVCTFSSGAFVGTCEAWKRKSAGNEIWGIQSGPMLLIDGKRHPAFREGSDSKLLRNGVGLDREKRLVFAITDKGEMVNFWDFAGLFLQLGCENALFLDGDISKMEVNPTKPVSTNLFGAMFVVAE
ncbi:MAG: phosphodiester glycosidase family protein [Verrucomicrobiota bacterium]